MKAAILAYLLSLPWHVTDAAETLEGRTARLDVLASAIVEAGGRRPVIVWGLAVTAAGESGLRRDVLSGACPEHECDRGRAIGAWQLHQPPTVPRCEWLTWAGDDPLPGALRAAGVLRWAIAICPTLEGAIGLYATGRACVELPSLAWRAAEIRRRAGR